MHLNKECFRVNKIDVVFGFALFLLLCITMLNTLIPSVIFSSFAVVILCLYLLVLIKNKPLAIVPLLGFIFIRAIELFSGLLIESGGYMRETELFGSSNGAFIRLVIYYCLFFHMLVVFYGKNIEQGNVTLKSTPISKQFLLISVVFCSLVIFSGLLAGLVKGFALFMGLNRFSFREFALTSELSFFLNNRLLAIVLLSCIFAFKETIKFKALAFFGALTIAIIAVLHGEQFTQMIYLSLAFFIGPLLKQSLLGINIRQKIIKIGFTSLALGSFTVLLVYSQQGVDVSKLAESRLLLQGQLWYVTDESNSSFFYGNLDSFLRNFNSFLFLNADSLKEPLIPYGMRELMHIHAAPSIYEVYMENNVTFTMGQMAMPLYWFGYFGMVPFIVLTAAMFSRVIKYFNSAIIRKDAISIILSMKLFTWYSFAFQQGEYWYIFGLKTTIFTLFVFLFEKYRGMLNLNFLKRPA